MITIGVLGSQGKSTVAEIIRDQLAKHGERSYIIGTSEDSSIKFFEILDTIDYAIIEVSREDILQKHLEKIKFDILIQTNIEQESEDLINEIQKLICNVKENGYVIFNSDSIQKINFQCDKIYPITYGLNGKTTVTASSIDDMQGICFSFCLQRAIVTVQNTLIQPFEQPVVMEGAYGDIYFLLPALTCMLILGFKF